VAVNTDECEHGYLQLLCYRCADRGGAAVHSSPASPVNLANHAPTKVAEGRIFATIAAAQEVHDPLDGLVENTAENTNSATQQHTATVLPSGHMEAGKGGEGGVFRITNAEFIAAVFTELPKVPLRPYARSPATRTWMDG
jgi:hypothetical protein